MKLDHYVGNMQVTTVVEGGYEITTATLIPCTDQDLNLEPSELGSVPSSEGDRSFPQENPPADSRKSNGNAPELREMPLPNGTGTALYNVKRNSIGLRPVWAGMERLVATTRAAIAEGR